MAGRTRVLCTLLLVVASSLAASAQRGGRGGGRGIDESARVGPTEPSAVYDSPEFGIRFQAPLGLQLYTPEKPGRFAQVLTNQRIIYLLNPSHPEETVTVKYSDNMTEQDLQGYKSALETDPPQAKLPGFRKLKVKSVRIGTRGDKDAVDYVYNVRQGNDFPATIRQVAFVHNGRGFVFTCTASEPLFAGTDQLLFAPLFSHLEFK